MYKVKDSVSAVSVTACLVNVTAILWPVVNGVQAFHFNLVLGCIFLEVLCQNFLEWHILAVFLSTGKHVCLNLNNIFLLFLRLLLMLEVLLP